MVFIIGYEKCDMLLNTSIVCWGHRYYTHSVLMMI